KNGKVSKQYRLRCRTRKAVLDLCLPCCSTDHPSGASWVRLPKPWIMAVISPEVDIGITINPIRRGKSNKKARYLPRPLQAQNGLCSISGVIERPYPSSARS